MNGSIVKDTHGLKHADKLFIGGQWVAAQDGGTIAVVDPATEETFVTIAEAGVSDVERAVAAARHAFDTGPWPRMSVVDRAAYLRAFADRLDQRVPDIARLWSHEMGIVHGFASAFSATLGETFRYYAGLADNFAWEERFERPAFGGDYALIVNEPVGVVGAIVPWNTPVVLAAYKVAPALIAGCTVILKMSPEAPLSGHVLAEIAQEIGLPPGVLNVITADRTASERLVTHDGVDKISFTGSSAAGQRIASICGERVARCTLELGGKSAGLVMDDFGIEDAADAIAPSACAITGQICSSLTRIIVSRHRHDDLVDALRARFAKVAIGNPFDQITQMGPLAMERQRVKVEQMVAQAVAGGARLAAGGTRPAGFDRGYYYEPTIFAHVDNADMAATEEFFGPVLSIIPVRDDDHAVQVANDTVYGLNNSVFTRDDDRAYAVARQLRSGTVGRNVFRSDMTIGFGGFKRSGIGREGGVNGLRSYLEPKTIIM